MESTKERLSTEAARLFAQRGYHGTSIGDLAAALGIQKASVYSHIKGKEELLAEIALAGAEAFHAALDRVPGRGARGDLPWRKDSTFQSGYWRVAFWRWAYR